ncbi:hypothetical protein Rs2_29278 [Raphanus sativus]|uniref:Uncharacterized protein LOC108808978 n=1 Tax=Raphanus sativus TaxID=3726 RepID=A0A9W3BXJ1_RAPSA|nr:uncharacterized protein LOC108808978 [Raphanus sativus]KAJ4889530.1 hypothetical protein Rs2_29278 [Raphanus sativus]
MCALEGKEVSGLRPFKNPKRRSSRGGSLALPINPTSSWGSSPTHLPPPPSYSQPPLLPLPHVNSSPLQHVKSSRPRVNNSSLLYSLARATSETLPRLPRTGSVQVRTNHNHDFPEGFDGYPGPAIMLLSPPPCSLPMPRFSIKPKLSCNAEAAGKTDVATDIIRRVLQLR